jgi:hypothetical protein
MSATLTLFQTIATELYNAFTKDNPRAVWCLKDESPEWMLDAILAAHWDDRLPDGWIYESCRDIASALAEEGNPTEDTISDIADSQTDTGTYDLLQWVATSVHNAECVDEANEASGTFEMFGDDYRRITGKRPEAPTLARLLQLGQMHARVQVGTAIYEAIQAQVTERESEWFAAHECEACDPIEHCPHGDES